MSNVKETTQSLGILALWAIGVGLVVSGESFGWNIGWGIIGVKSFFIPVIIAACLYFSLAKNLIELTCIYPNAEGPQTFAELAFGKTVGNFISIILLIEFLFAIPAVANAISEYLGFLFGGHSFDLWIATLLLIAFCGINFFNVTLKIKFIILLTGLAILELAIFSLSILPEFDLSNFSVGSHENPSFENIMLALPYAVWMFLAIEGLSLFTKYADKAQFRQTITNGYVYSILTLFALCGIVLMLSGGSILWTEETWSFITSNNHPMPAILATVLGSKSIIVKIFTFLGLFGLIASFQGVIETALIQCENIQHHYFSMFSKKNISSAKIKINSILFIICFGLLSIWTSTTKTLIDFSAFSAGSLYICIALSLFELKEKDSLYTIKYFFKWSSRYILSTVIISSICILSFIYSHYETFFVFLAFSVFYFLNYWYLMAEQEKQRILSSYNVFHPFKHRLGGLERTAIKVVETFEKKELSIEEAKKLAIIVRDEVTKVRNFSWLAYLSYYSALDNGLLEKIYTSLDSDYDGEITLKFSSKKPLELSKLIEDVFYTTKKSYKAECVLKMEQMNFSIVPYFKNQNHTYRLSDLAYDAIFFELINNYAKHCEIINKQAILDVRCEQLNNMNVIVFSNPMRSKEDNTEWVKLESTEKAGGLTFVCDTLKNTQSGCIFKRTINGKYEVALAFEGML